MNQRLGYIDALRGIAALSVIIYHVIYNPGFELSYSSVLHPVLGLGFTGVTLFFLVSAFTLCLTLDNRITEKNWVSKFYFRRAGRILPLYYAWLIVMLFYPYANGIGHQKASILFFLLFTFNFVPGLQPGIVFASWTLAVEMIFYVIFPWIILHVNNLKKSILLFSASVIFAFIHYHYTFDIPGYLYHDGFFNQLPVFCVGIMTYWAYKIHLPRIVDVKKMAAVFFALFVLLFAACSLMIFLPYNMITYAIAVAYGCLLLGLALIPDTRLANRITIFLGRISYSLYLNHTLVILYLIPVYKDIYDTHFPAFLKMPICVLITLSLVTVISCITYHLIEKPGARLISGISKAFFRTSSPDVYNKMMNKQADGSPRS
jgi:peptidoglycan/LPS O-acetylase OafA/YrhL